MESSGAHGLAERPGRLPEEHRCCADLNKRRRSREIIWMPYTGGDSMARGQQTRRTSTGRSRTSSATQFYEANFHPTISRQAVAKETTGSTPSARRAAIMPAWPSDSIHPNEIACFMKSASLHS